MYSKWLGFCPLFNFYPNVVRFHMVLRAFNATQKRRGDSVFPWNITDFIGIFPKRVPHAASCAFHWLMDSLISLIIFLLTPCSFNALNIHECHTKS